MITLFIYSCSKNNHEDPTKSIVYTNVPNASSSYHKKNICSDIVHYDFIAGRNIKIGDVSIYNSKHTLYIEFSTIDNWFVGHTHLFVGNIKDIPQTPSRDLMLGNFPYNTSHDLGTKNYIYEIPLETLGQCFDIVIHAETFKTDEQNNVIQTETAYIGRTRLNHPGSWAIYNHYCIQE